MNKKTISCDELKKLLNSKPPEVIETINNLSTICIQDYEIKDEYLILDNTQIISLPLKFINCSFTSDNLFFIDGLQCTQDVCFESCTFVCSIHFASGLFKKELTFKYVHAESIDFHGGTFNNINLSIYDPKKVWLGAKVKFEKLYIGKDLVNNNIDKLVIFSSSTTGDITVTGHCLQELTLSGTNPDKKFNFSKIKCDKILIDNFKNEGTLNFYGMAPNSKTPLSERFFQIISSDLTDAKFYRTFFSDYKEVVVIDSFITDTLFLSCKWELNIRSLRGPGFLDFNASKRDIIGTDENFGIREAYRQLKISMSNHSNKIQEAKFNAAELTYYNKTLPWSNPFTSTFWDKIILYASSLFSNYGQSFLRPLLALLAGQVILFLIALFFNGFYPLHFSIHSPESTAFEQAFEKYFIYINPFRKLETSFSGYLIIVDILMRIWSSYMIYNLIRATRRFIS